MKESLILQGLDLLTYGMGTVFVFLTVLVIATGWMSAIISRLFPEPTLPATPAKPSAMSQTQAIDPKVVKIIQAALEKHRNRD
ncbi:OadG family protein [Halioxenophilus sp. WMMB6]|uniref:OadG family protein n=1 Tax=Halioxenophilus sp. WMMB6 TaxID=3073815 RepID=UPI00295E232D|nr:OadG family protein [Halioxenophilus sp. WMMB6]